MRGYVEKLERLEYLLSREVTDEEVREAMADEYAARIDDARSRAKDAWMEAPDPVDAITNYEDRRG